MPRLTEQEQQEIIRYLEADKPLPDKYRFLLFEDKSEVELVWNGKTSEVCNIVLPFQVIEQVDEPRAEKDTRLQMSMFGLDSRGRQLKGWTNKLIWGDNKLILSSLKNGPLREEIERQGGIKLIYIDPPFDVGADFSMNIQIGDDTFTKRPNILEEIAYRDTWGKGADSFIAMMYERLVLMRDLLAKDGSILVHCDWRVTSYIRLVLDEVFGKENYRNEIVWRYRRWTAGSKKYQRMHDTLHWCTKSENYLFTQQFEPFSEKTVVAKYKRKVEGGRAVQDKTQLMERKGEGVSKHDVWEIPFIHPVALERLGYPTQKPEELIGTIIEGHSHPGDLIADFFCGSGTTAAVAEKLGRKWIVADLGKFAIHTTRKRMIGVQRKLKAEGQNYRAFEILNLGKYERQHYIGINPNLREAERQKQLEEKETAFLDLILRAYCAEKTDGFATFHGKKTGRLVAVGPVNLPVTRLFVEEVILECRQKHITRVDILGFEFEMGLFPNVLDEARAKGIDIAPKYIPAEVFDKRAVEKNQVVFHDVSYIEVKPHVKKNSVAVELTDFSVFYSQDSIANAEASLKNKKSKIVVERGQIVKVSKNVHGIVSREVLTKKWTDWIDYWAVDFNYESKREIVRVKRDGSRGDAETRRKEKNLSAPAPLRENEKGELPRRDAEAQGKEKKLSAPAALRENTETAWEEVWTGDYVFENEWQSFRTKKDRSLELMSVYHECLPGRRKLAVKVVDIFGNDTMTIVEVMVGGKK